MNEESRTLLIETPKPLNKLEVARVSDNMRSHSNSRFFEHIGAALMWSTDEQSKAVKEAWPDEWAKWNCDLDENGRLVLDGDEIYWPL
ncbi:MAG: hypothetical protein ACXAB9_11050 [Candidatus Thorarchaeota archaeon]